jgi:tetratricopeptide (TPR) repeat protein
MNRLDHLLGLLKDSPNDAFLLFALAKEYEKGGDEANSLHYYLKLKAADPNYVGLYYHLGKLYEKQQNFEAAIAIYRAGIEVSRQVGDRHAQSELAGALMEIEE